MTSQKSSGPACCSWCRDDERSIYMKRDGLCRSCYSISRELARAEAHWRQLPKNIHAKFNYMVAKRKKEIAQYEGQTCGDIDSRKPDGMDLEMEFRFLSRRLRGKEMFFGCANIFDWDFKPKQRKILLSFLVEMQRAYLRKVRYRVALTAVDLKDDEWQAYL